MNQLEQIFATLLEECEGLFHKEASVLPHVWEDYYKSLLKCAKCSGEQIGSIDPIYRVKLCQMLDRVLDEIVDRVPFSRQLKGGVYTPAVQGYRRWNNVELLKDKCLTGYMTAKELDTTAYMYYFKENDKLPFLKNVPDLEIVTNSTIDKESYTDYMKNNAHNMDILMFHGMYYVYGVERANDSL